MDNVLSLMVCEHSASTRTNFEALMSNFVATILPRETYNFYDVVNAIWRDVVLVSITSEVNAPVSCM